MEKKTVRNCFGQTINCCCASCRYRDIDADGVRICLKDCEMEEGGTCCPEWKLNDGLRWAGCGRGRIKRREYLMYVQAVRNEEYLDIMKGYIEEEDMKPVEAIRSDFEEFLGSIYEEF